MILRFWRDTKKGLLLCVLAFCVSGLHGLVMLLIRSAMFFIRHFGVWKKKGDTLYPTCTGP
ncbi:hypothetical protein BDZ91DRAFT_725957 [Kalaharituber pfeilii]|nr:hypothetical protein BDZ91DRAFT_725957 [Kalaharituber pfeilii]